MNGLVAITVAVDATKRLGQVPPQVAPRLRTIARWPWPTVRKLVALGVVGQVIDRVTCVADALDRHAPNLPRFDRSDLAW